jgi:hypothetical protein
LSREDIKNNRSTNAKVKNEKTPKSNQGLFKELEFKIGFWTELGFKLVFLDFWLDIFSLILDRSNIDEQFKILMRSIPEC